MTRLRTIIGITLALVFCAGLAGQAWAQQAGPVACLQTLLKAVERGDYPTAWGLVTSDSQLVLSDSVIRAFEKQFPEQAGRVNRTNVAKDLATPGSDRARYAWEPFRNKMLSSKLSSMTFEELSNDGSVAKVGIKGSTSGYFSVYRSGSGWRVDLSKYLK